MIPPQKKSFHGSLLKLGFQGWFLTSPDTGIGQHCLGLLRELSQRKDVKLVIPVPEPVRVKGISGASIHVLRPPFWLPHRALKKWYWESVTVPQFFAKQALDWEYYPYPTPLPRLSPHLRALTVHDLILWKDTRVPRASLKKRYLHSARRSLVYADHVFTVTESIHKELGLPIATVLPNAEPPIPAHIPKLSYQDALVYLGGYEQRKQVPLLVKTFEALKDPTLRLVLIGEAPHESAYYPSVPEHPKVICLGRLPDDKVYAVLKSALAFVHLSDSEGFNIPLLQAMKVGAPVIVRDLPVNREVSRNSALFLPDTYSVSSLKTALSAMLKTIRSPGKRKAQIAAQKKAAAQYSWGKSAQIFLHSLKPHGR